MCWIGGPVGTRRHLLDSEKQLLEPRMAKCSEPNSWLVVEFVDFVRMMMNPSDASLVRWCHFEDFLEERDWEEKMVQKRGRIEAVQRMM